MAVDGRYISGKDVDNYEKILKKSAASGGLRTEIESGTEAPDVLMPGSPLKELENVGTKTAKTALDMQKKKEDRLEVKSTVNSAQIKRDRTKKEYDDYVNSQEYRQKRTADIIAQQIAKDRDESQSFASTSEMAPPIPQQDEKEMRLRAARDQAEKEYNEAEDKKRFEADMEVINGLSEEDRKRLEVYSASKYSDRELPEEYLVDSLLEDFGRERLDELERTYSRYKNAKRAEEVDAKAREFVSKRGGRGTLANILSVPVQAYSGIIGTFGQLAETMIGTGGYKTQDPNAYGTIGQTLTGAIRGQTSENITEDLGDGFAGKAANIGYQGVMAAADSVAQAYLGGGGLGGATLAATNSFSQTMADASRKGATPAQAAVLATTTAGIEALTEKIPLDNLIRTAKGTNAKSVIANALRQAGIEATTEEISLLGSVLAEAAILQEKSSYQQDVINGIMSGMSPDEAILQASKNILEEAKNTALVSMISGGASSLGASAADRMGMFAEEQANNNPEVNKPKSGDVAKSRAALAQKYGILGAEQDTQTQQPIQTEKTQQIDTQQQATEPEVQKPTQVAEQPEQAPQKEKDLSDTMADVFREMQEKNGKASNRMAETVMSDPAAMQELGITPEGTKAEQRRRVKEEMGKLFQKQNSQNEPVQNVPEAKPMQATETSEQATKQASAPTADMQMDTSNQSVEGGQIVDEIKELLDYIDRGVDRRWLRERSNAFLRQYEEIQKNKKYGEQYTAEESDRLKELHFLYSAYSSAAKDVNGTRAMYRSFIANLENNNVSENVKYDRNGRNELSDTEIKGTGAAEQNFTGKPTYNAILSEDNAQPDRRNDVRPMELPATDVNGGNVSATTANVYGSQNTPDDLAAAMEEPVSRGDFSYVRISNDAATQRAQQTIGESGSWESARDNFRMDVDRGLAGAELSARGALILNHAAEVYEQAKASGDSQAAAKAKREWLTILSDVQKLGTNTAQGLQALRIIRDLMPQDKIEFAQIAVQNMVRDMKLGADIQIDQQLLTDYENATTDQQRDEIMEKIQQNVADQIPSTVLDKWNALRYTNMLGNLKTNVRNVVGNAANTIVYRFKDATGAVLESIANKVSRGKSGRTKSVIVNNRLQKAMEPYYQQVKNAVSSGGKYGENNTAAGDFAQGVMDKRQIFKFKPLESYRKATNWMMNNEYFGDEAFGKAAFTHAMAGYLQANGVKDIQNASPELIDRAMVYAVREAQETTFHDNSALANILGKLKKDSGVVGEGLIPFTKTPANVLTRAEEYSPLGIINTAVTAVKAANPNSDVTGTDVINSLSKTLTGSAIFALGAILKSHGILNGGPDEDDEQAAFDKMNGIQSYSINLPNGTTYTLDWLTPVAMPLFMGAQLMDIASKKDLTFADLEQVFTSIADPMIQMSMMQGINSSLESIRYSENNMGQFFINAAVNYLTQGLTNTLLGQLERSTEENRMTTYIDKDSQVPQWMQQSLGKASQKIPGWDYQQTEYIDARGEKQRNEGGFAYELLSPGYSQKVRDDAVTSEMNRLRESTGENVFPDTASRTITYTDKRGTVHKDHNLTAEQYQIYAQTQGQTAQKLWEDVANTADFDALTDAQKVKVSEDIKEYSREVGEIAAIGKDNHTGYSNGWMQDVEKGGAMEIIQRTIASSLSSAKDNLTNAWKNGYDEEAFIREMENAFQTFQNASGNTQRQIYDESSSSVKNYIDARENGISNEQYLSVAKALSGVGDTIIEKSRTIVQQPRLSESQKTLLVKQNVSDTQDENIDLLKALGYGITDYVDLYGDYKNYTSGKGKKNRTINKWMKDYGISYAAAKKLYEVFP